MHMPIHVLIDDKNTSYFEVSQNTKNVLSKEIATPFGKNKFEASTLVTFVDGSYLRRRPFGRPSSTSKSDCPYPNFVLASVK